MTQEIAPTFQDISPSNKAAPTMNDWYFSTTAEKISEEALPWMLAQGWKITATRDIARDPPSVYEYTMQQTKMLSYNVLQDLLVDFTNAYNEGRSANDKRYEDVLGNWQAMLDRHQNSMTSFDSRVRVSGGYLNVMITRINDLNPDYDAMKSDWDSYDTPDRDAALTALKTQWENTATTAASEYDTTVSGLNLPELIADADGAIDDFAAAVTAFNNEFAGLSTTLLSDFNTHRDLTRGYLTGLGTTETARINEKWDNTLAGVKQDLVDRGFYSSIIPAAVTIHNERERSEDLAALNDKLNREKVANEHTLYGQQYKARFGGLEVSLKSVDAAAKIVQTRMGYGSWASEIRHRIAGISINARLQLLGIREKYYRTLLDSISWESNRRLQVYNELVQVRLKQFELTSRTMDKDFELIKYQLDTRNDLAIGLFGFVEKRTDDYPDMGSLAQLTASLGETGAATWQST